MTKVFTHWKVREVLSQRAYEGPNKAASLSDHRGTSPLTTCLTLGPSAFPDPSPTISFGIAWGRYASLSSTGTRLRGLVIHDPTNQSFIATQTRSLYLEPFCSRTSITDKLEGIRQKWFFSGEIVHTRTAASPLSVSYV